MRPMPKPIVQRLSVRGLLILGVLIGCAPLPGRAPTAAPADSQAFLAQNGRHTAPPIGNRVRTDPRR